MKNTDKQPALEPFTREERYIVIKRKLLNKSQEAAIKATIGRMNVSTVECVVVESDWPEYEKVWNMIENRCSSKLPALEAVAWPAHVSGASLGFDGGIVNVNRDGSGSLAFAENDLEWEQNDESGKEYCYVNIPKSEFDAIRDFLDKWLPRETHLTDLDRANEIIAGLEALVEQMALALEPFAEGYSHTLVFLKSREKMHRDGLALYDADVERAADALAAYRKGSEMMSSAHHAGALSRQPR